MKAKTIFSTLIITALTVATFTSCDDEVNGKEVDGKWDPMKWKTEVNMGKEHQVQVPAKGGTYTFTCTNYFPWLADLEINGKFIHPEEIDDDVITNYHRINYDWFSAEASGQELTVTIAPNTASETRSGRLCVTAGDIFDYFTFTQSGN